MKNALLWIIGLALVVVAVGLALGWIAKEIAH